MHQMRESMHSGGEREEGEVFVHRWSRCPVLDYPKELRFSDKYYHHGEERKGSEIINQKSIVPVTEYVLKVGFN